MERSLYFRNYKLFVVLFYFVLFRFVFISFFVFLFSKKKGQQFLFAFVYVHLGYFVVLVLIWRKSNRISTHYYYYIHIQTHTEFKVNNYHNTVWFIIQDPSNNFFLENAIKKNWICSQISLFIWKYNPFG